MAKTKRAAEISCISNESSPVVLLPPDAIVRQVHVAQDFENEATKTKSPEISRVVRYKIEDSCEKLLALKVMNNAIPPGSADGKVGAIGSI